MSSTIRGVWLIERVPELAGRTLRAVYRGAPGVLGPLLVAVGLGLAWLPLGVIAAGAILWALDWRIPDEHAEVLPLLPLQVQQRAASRRERERQRGRRWRVAG